ncbi:Beta-1,3-galactosyltransferase 1 [Exaiptasia diaphana]|nr:Beta-1,3-galactosyltransferase 1 [Exaiptasia diaphana]
MEKKQVVILAIVAFNVGRFWTWIINSPLKPQNIVHEAKQNRPIQPAARVYTGEFNLTLPFVEPKLSSEESSLYLAVVVNTGANEEKHRTLRQTIRKTWGNTSESLGNVKNLKWKLFFALGIATNQSYYAASLQEARDHNDVIIGNFSDTYRNVVMKTFMGLLWSATKLSCKFVLKTDDDVYVRVPQLMTWLENTGSPRSFYGGVIGIFDVIPRNPKSQWYIPYELHDKEKWPPWLQGAYTVFSSDTLPRYLIYTYRRKPFHTDDAYLGVASEDLQIKAVQIPGFVIEHYDFDRSADRTCTTVQNLSSTNMY